MDVNALRLFVDVARRLSFAAVADQRGSSPSSVSRAIGQLERELGVRLLQRTTRSMTLTEAGAAYLARVADVIEELDAAGDAARMARSEPAGTLRLTASVAFGERIIVPLLPELRREYPKIRPELVFSDANLDLVAEGIDLAIRLGRRRGGDVVASRLFETRYRVVASPGYLQGAPAIRTPGDIAEHRCTVFALPEFRTGWRFRPRSGDGKLVEVAVRAGSVVSSALSLRSVVLGGAGPALLADWLIGDDLAAGRLVDVLPGHDATATDFETAAWLMYPSRSFLPQKVRATADFLKQRLQR